MENLTNNQRNFLELVAKARNLHFNIDKIVKKDPIKQEEKRKILALAHKNIHDNGCVEVLLILIKRNILIKTALFFLIKYYIKSFEQGSINENDDFF